MSCKQLQTTVTLPQAAVKHLIDLNTNYKRENSFFDICFMKILLLSCLGYDKMDKTSLNKLHTKFIYNMFEIRNKAKLPILKELIDQAFQNYQQEK